LCLRDPNKKLSRRTLMTSLANIDKYIMKDSCRSFGCCSIGRIRHTVQTWRSVRTASDDSEEASNRRHLGVAVKGGRASLLVPDRNMAALFSHSVV